MPSLEILAIGRLKDGAEKTLEERYWQRISKAGPAHGLKPGAIREFTESTRQSADERKASEAEMLLTKAGGTSCLIALDENGRQHTSQAFAEHLANLRDEGHQNITFIIGGPDGHGEAALAAARQKLALSKLTLPHAIARILLLEQIYRSLTIWSGHPYHRP